MLERCWSRASPTQFHDASPTGQAGSTSFRAQALGIKLARAPVSRSLFRLWDVSFLAQLHVSCLSLHTGTPGSQGGCVIGSPGLPMHAQPSVPRSIPGPWAWMPSPSPSAPTQSKNEPKVSLGERSGDVMSLSQCSMDETDETEGEAFMSPECGQKSRQTSVSCAGASGARWSIRRSCMLT